MNTGELIANIVVMVVSLTIGLLAWYKLIGPRLTRWIERRKQMKGRY